MIAGYVTVWVVFLSVCAVAGAALVECKPVRHRAADLQPFFNLLIMKLGPKGPCGRYLQSSQKSLLHTLSHSLLDEIEGRIDLILRSPCLNFT